ncbi:3-oxoacyl-ACP reductase [Kordiimonas sediminis]|uniref:3-oxoacyl-ACP reductase n=1 Tax=Kordiimonas sediminis TaxID=1735581 RepID=A0A919AXZ7_9PROT|nr:SDR family oxidoreductase [Kordiimonas sediminis]GHF31105.1 3-oxoacyl-ACP reductase [Kordiimonas sediminis]
MSNILNEHFSLTGKVVLITGASSGIGEQLARAAARAGADVALAARRLDKIEKTAADIAAETGQKVIAVKLDVTDGDSVTACFDTVEAALGTVTVVGNNAGMAIPKWALEDTEEDWDRTMNTNLKGVWRVAQTAAKRMADAGVGGSIINTASILGLGVSPQQTTYATSKAGVVHLTKAMALELGRFGVRVNAICPGYFVTEINEEFLSSDNGQKMLRSTPARRAGKLSELEAPFLMLAADGASFISGVALPVDACHSIKLVGG